MAATGPAHPISIAPHFPAPTPLIMAPPDPKDPPDDEDFRNAIDYENRVRDALGIVFPPLIVCLDLIFLQTIVKME